jgi:hypothetical protein
MKFISTLPKCFGFTKQNEKGAYLFSDHKSDLIRVTSPTLEIHDQEWAIVTREYRQKSEQTEYPYRLILKLFPLDETNQNLPKVKIEREIIKGTFASTNRTTIYFAAFSLERLIWLVYSIY